MEKFVISEDIRVAQTLPAEVYRDPEWLVFARENIFPNSWQYAGFENTLSESNTWMPFEFVEGFIREPLLLSRDNHRKLKDTPFQRAVNAIDQTELEDQEVVESTQLGIRSRLYQRGRYSPQHEKGVHHFHRILATFSK